MPVNPPAERSSSDQRIHLLHRVISLDVGGGLDVGGSNEYW